MSILESIKKILSKLFVVKKDHDKLLSEVMKALVLTHDYCNQALLCKEGYEWFDICRKIEKLIPDDNWTKQFRERVKDESGKNTIPPRNP